MPETITRNVADWSSGAVEMRRTGAGVEVSTTFVLTNVDGEAVRRQRPFDLSLLTSAERTNLAAILRKIARLQTLAALKAADAVEVFAADDGTGTGRSTWTFTEA